MKLKVSDDGVTVDNAKVVKTDLMAANGVIHVIDTVIMPNSWPIHNCGAENLECLRLTPF